jgi:uncharacterized protein YjiS (DUF1127 family)
MSTIQARAAQAARRSSPGGLTRQDWSWARRIRRAADLLLTWQQRARDRRQLQSLSDHMLRDIGLTRADAWAESDKPFWRP